MPGKVTVVVTLYNYEKYIRECLQSVMDQSYQDWECIVVDDCSTDQGRDIVLAARAVDNRIYLRMQHHNKGYGVAKNYGIREARGEFIRPLDADDKLKPNALEVAVKAFDEHPEVDLVHGYAVRWYGGDDTRGVNKKTYCHAQGRMWRRSVYDRFGLYYEPLRSMGDKEYLYRLGVHPDSPLPKLAKDLKIKTVVALYRKHDLQMHKVRKYNKPELNKKIKRQFKTRIKQLQSDGITRGNTSFPGASLQERQINTLVIVGSNTIQKYVQLRKTLLASIRKHCKQQDVLEYDFGDINRVMSQRRKASVMLSALRDGYDQVAWLDADILVRGDFAPFWDDLGPRTLKIQYRPEHKSSDMKFNAGVIGLGRSPETIELAEHWVENIDGSKNPFADQEGLWRAFCNMKNEINLVPISRKWNDSRFGEDSIIWHAKGHSAAKNKSFNIELREYIS